VAAMQVKSIREEEKKNEVQAFFVKAVEKVKNAEIRLTPTKKKQVETPDASSISAGGGTKV